jgi:hypothetical protein
MIDDAWLSKFGPELPSLQEERAEIDRLVVESIAAAQLYKELLSRGLEEKLADRRSKWSRAVALLDSAVARARNRICTERGWRTVSPFALSELRGWRWTDLVADREPFIGRYADYFGNASGANVAIIGHTTRSWAKAQAFAVRNGLRAELLPYSWYVPGMAAVLYQKAP